LFARESEVPMSSRFTRSVLAATIVASAFAGWGSRAALAGDDKMAVTAVGCLQGEREYRREHEHSKFAGTGTGLSNEYILIDAVIGGPEMAVTPSTEQESTHCIAARGNGQAFELTGAGEDALAPLLGRRVVIHGMLKHAEHDTPVGTSGTFTPVPTNGGSPLGSDLKIREINVESASLAPVAEAARNEPAIFGAPEPQPEPPPAAAEPQAPAPAAEPEKPAPALPKTASPLPLIGLIGLLSLACGLGLRLFNRTSARYS
jgi:hypothetical protein